MTYVGLGIPFTVVFICGILGWLWVSSRDRAWQSAADTFDLRWDKGGWLTSPSLDGLVDGIPVTVDVVRVGPSRRNKSRATRVEAPIHQAAPAGLKVHGDRQGISAFHGPEVSQDDADLAFNVQADDPDEAMALLKKPDVKRAIWDGLSAYATLCIDNGVAYIQVMGLPTDADTLEGYIQGVVDLAEAINMACEQSAPNPMSAEPDEASTGSVAQNSGQPATAGADRDEDMPDGHW